MSLRARLGNVLKRMLPRALFSDFAFSLAAVLCDFLYFSLNSPALKASMFSGIARAALYISALAIIKMLLRSALGGKRRDTARREKEAGIDTTTEEK